MNVPPEVRGCLSLASRYERSCKDYWKKGNGFRQKAFKTKCETKIARLVARAARLLANRGIDVTELTNELRGQHGQDQEGSRSPGALSARPPEWP